MRQYHTFACLPSRSSGESIKNATVSHFRSFGRSDCEASVNLIFRLRGFCQFHVTKSDRITCSKHRSFRMWGFNWFQTPQARQLYIFATSIAQNVRFLSISSNPDATVRPFRNIDRPDCDASVNFKHPKRNSYTYILWHSTSRQHQQAQIVAVCIRHSISRLRGFSQFYDTIFESITCWQHRLFGTWGFC